MNDAHCLQRRYIAFFSGNEQLMESNGWQANEVEVRFRASKGDQERKGTILVTVKGGTGAHRDEGAVA